MTQRSAPSRRILWSSLGGTVLGGLVYLCSLLNFSTELGRSATKFRYAANFFEVQATAFMDGHLWVPDKSMAIEGFIQPDGHTYMYFGPFPALLRIPMLLVTDDFNGQLTVASMLIAWVVFAVFAVRLCWSIRDLLRPDTEVSRTDAVLALILVAGLTGGTVLTFDAALPWVYHEVYLWQSAFVVAALYWMIRVVRDPSPRAFAWLGVCAAGATLTRTTGGWGVCIATFALAIWMYVGKTSSHRRWAWMCVAAGALPLAAAIAVNWAKFGHLFMFPLENQVWTELNAHRREALEINGGSITGLQFFWPALIAYFGPGVRFVDYFPWITLPADPATGHGAFIDQAYRTGSVVGLMPLFLLLGLLALPFLLRRTAHLPHGAGVRMLRPPLLAVFLMTGGVMAYGYFATRYTSEFVPALVLGSLVSLWAWLAPLAARGRVVRALLVVPLVLGVAYSMWANTATGLTAAAFQYQGDKLARYLTWQNAISGGPGSSFAGLFTTSDEMPEGGTPDQIHVRGNCEGLYVNTGETEQRWVTAEEATHVVEVRFPEKLADGETVLFDVEGGEDRRVTVTVEDKYAWVTFHNEGGKITGSVFIPAPGETMRVGLRTDAALGVMELSSTPGGFVGYVPAQEWGDDWHSILRTVTTPWTADRDTDPQTGISVTSAPGVSTSLCRQLVRDNDISLP